MKNMVIHAHATLYDAYASKATFRAEVSLAIDITGKILLNGKVTFGDNLTMDGFFYADLTKVKSGFGRFIFLLDMPGNPLRTTLGGISIYGVLDFGLTDATGTRVETAALQSLYYTNKVKTDTLVVKNGKVYLSNTSLDELKVNTAAGDVQMSVAKGNVSPTDGVITPGAAVNSGFNAAQRSIVTFDASSGIQDGDTVIVTYTYQAANELDANGKPIPNPNAIIPEPVGFQIRISGGIRADVFDNTLFAELSGNVTLTFTSSFFKVDVDAKLEISYLGVLATAAGSLTFADNNGTFEIYGALVISTGDALKKLEQYGIVIAASSDVRGEHYRRSKADRLEASAE